MNTNRATEQAGNRKGRRRSATLAGLASIEVRLLALQFLLGTYLTTFVALPALAVDGLIVLVLHILLGFMILGLAGRMIFVAAKTRDRGGILFSGIGILGVVVSILGGLGFTFGGQSDDLSFAMATGFFVTLLCAGFLVARRSTPTSSTTATAEVSASDDGTTPLADAREIKS